jgi:gamma-glutamyltranspeptidase/glutathione hydrolase
LRRIAEGGRDAFYTGPVAEDIVAELQELGGLHTLDDFAAQDANLVTPISAPYGGLDVLQLPPSNHGIVALVMFGILARLGKPQGGPVSAERFHVLIEAARLAYAMRDKFVADPDMADVPVEHMLSDGFLDEMAARIDLKRRTPDLGPIPDASGSDTVYLTVVDEAGMVVSFINSLFSAFGSGIVTRKTGVTLQNRGTGFVLTPGHPNCIAPRKRPMHTLIPGMATRNGRPVLSFGVMGGAYQSMGHVFIISNMVDYGMDAQEALDCARVFFEGDTVSLETAVPEAVARGLQDMGHATSWRPDPWGGGQIVAIDHDNGVLIGASDSRKDGLALGY